MLSINQNGLLRRARLLYLATALALACAAAPLFAGCGGTETPRMNVETNINGGGELVFEASANDFVASCNSVIDANGCGLSDLAPFARWTRLDEQNAPLRGGVVTPYRFQYDQTILTEPTITLYTSDGGEHIAGITVDFDDHGFSEHHSAMFRLMCCCAVGALLPELSETAISEICDELINAAYDNAKEAPFDGDAAPDVMYICGEAAVYSYFALGDYLHLGLTPVDTAAIDAFAASGTELRAVD